MKKIKEEITGGKVYEGLFGGFDLFDAPGITTAKVRETTYEAELTIPYTIKISEEIEPKLDKKGEPRELDPRQSFDIDIKFPMDTNGIEGEIKMFAYVTRGTPQEEVPKKIMQQIGNNLAALKFRKED